MNLYLKEGDPGSPDRIDAYIRMMNGLRSAEDNIRAALGEDRTDPSESRCTTYKQLSTHLNVA